MSYFYEENEELTEEELMEEDQDTSETKQEEKDNDYEDVGFVCRRPES